MVAMLKTDCFSCVSYIIVMHVRGGQGPFTTLLQHYKTGERLSILGKLQQYREILKWLGLVLQIFSLAKEKKPIYP